MWRKAIKAKQGEHETILLQALYLCICVLVCAILSIAYWCPIRAYSKQPTNAQQLSSLALHDGVFTKLSDQQCLCNLTNKIVDVHDDQLLISGRVGGYHEQMFGCHENEDAQSMPYIVSNGVNMRDEFLQIWIVDMHPLLTKLKETTHFGVNFLCRLYASWQKHI